jgi:hypothetical protein
MEKLNFEKIIEKVLLNIFYFLCICAFFMVVKDLPSSVCAFLGCEYNDGDYIMLSLFACGALLGYVINYYENKKNDEISSIRTKHFEELNALKNVYKLYNLKGGFITKFNVTEVNKIEITLLNKYIISLDLHFFSSISTEEDFIKFDQYFLEYFSKNDDKNLKTETEKIIYKSNLESYTKQYFKNK